MRLDDYDQGFSLTEFFFETSPAIATAQDNVSVSFETDDFIDNLQKLRTMTEAEARQHFDLADHPTWTWAAAQSDVKAGGIPWRITYRPFDDRSIYLTGRVGGLHPNPQSRLTQHMLEETIGLAFSCWISEDRPFADALVFTGPIHQHALSPTDTTHFAPLHLAPSEDDPDQSPAVNFSPDLLDRFQEAVRMPHRGPPKELQVFDYLYGVLHWPKYRTAFQDRLIRGAPRIPWPTDFDMFREFWTRGSILRKLHLMDPIATRDPAHWLVGEGDDDVVEPRFQDGTVWINDNQGFEKVPPLAWEFTIGAYRPAQAWLEARRGRILSRFDIDHYRRILKVLVDSDLIMNSFKAA